MLRVVSTSSCTSGVVTCDQYVPLAFRAYPEVICSPYMWRTGDIEHSLLEFKIHPERRTIAAVTLVSAVGANYKSHLFTLGSIPTKHGIPVVDTNVFPTAEFPKNRIDERLPLSIALHDNMLEIAFGAPVNPIYGIQCGQLGFIVNADEEVCGLFLSQISPGQVAAIKTSLN